MIKSMKILSGALVLVLLLAGSAATACAHEALDSEREDCSLAVVMKYGGKPVAGGSLTLYRVGNVIEDDGNFSFEMRPELSCNADMEGVQSEKAAKEVCDCVKRRNLSGITVNIDEEGIASFSRLTAGLYLIRQETAAPGFSSQKPFLISVPQWDGEHYIYNVTAASKTAPHKLPVPQDKPDPLSDTKLPQTGQLNWPVPVLLALGGIFLITGYIMKKKKDA